MYFPVFMAYSSLLQAFSSVKVKLSRYSPCGGQGERIYSSYSFFGTRWYELSAPRLSPALPPGKGSRYPMDRRLGGSQELAWAQRLEEKILCLCRRSNPGRPICTQTLYWLSYPGSLAFSLLVFINETHVIKTDSFHILRLCVFLRDQVRWLSLCWQ
jgi:hypothetical protein